MIGSVILLSFSAIIVRYAQGEGVPSILIAGSRMLLASILITPLVLTRYLPELRALERRHVLLLMLTGIWMSVNGMLVILSLEHIPVLTNQMLASTAPIWAAFIEVTWLKARLHPLIWFGTGLVIAGGFIISLPQSNTTGHVSLFGVALALISAVCGAIYNALGRRVRPHVTIIPYLWVVYGCGGLFAFAIVLVLNIQLTGYSAAGYGWIALSTLMVQLVGFSGMAYALGYFPATVVVLTTRGATVWTAFLAFLFFAEAPTIVQVTGSAVLFGGIVVAVVGQEVTERRWRALEKRYDHERT
jgi:drug/metabolite transporter (DMT)-like permease